MAIKGLLLLRLAAVLALAGLAGCVGAPVYAPTAYAPPGYATPGYAPAGYAAQPSQQGYATPEQPAQAYAATCYAGVYTCALAQSLPVGAPCSCPGLGAPSYGNVR